MGYLDPPDDPPCVTEFQTRAVKKTRKPWQCYLCGKKHEAGTACGVLPFKDFEQSPPKFDQVRFCPGYSCYYGDY